MLRTICSGLCSAVTSAVEMVRSHAPQSWLRPATCPSVPWLSLQCPFGRGGAVTSRQDGQMGKREFDAGSDGKAVWVRQTSGPSFPHAAHPLLIAPLKDYLETTYLGTSCPTA